MSDRISRALRELASALDEVEAAAGSDSPRSSSAWSVLAGEAAARASTSGSRTGTEGGVGPSSAVSYHSDLRHYVIIKDPNSPTRVGYLVGEGAATWRWIEGGLRDGRLAGSGAKLRRVKSKQEAATVWAEAFPGKEMPTLRA